MHNSVVGSTSRDLSQLESTMAKLRKSGSRSCADLVVAYSTRLRLGLALARLRLQVGFKPELQKHYLDISSNSVWTWNFEVVMSSCEEVNELRVSDMLAG